MQLIDNEKFSFTLFIWRLAVERPLLSLSKVHRVVMLWWQEVLLSHIVTCTHGRCLTGDGAASQQQAVVMATGSTQGYPRFIVRTERIDP